MKISLHLLMIFLFLPPLVFAQNDTKRVACIGNSITVGEGLKNSNLDSYPSQLGMILGNSYEVKNFGASGHTLLKKGNRSYWNAPQLQQALEYRPDIVVIMLGTNDSKRVNWIYKDEFIPDYISMIDTFRQVETKPVIYACYPPPSFDDAYVRDSIVTTEMIPMIDIIVDSVGVSLIDVHSPLADKEYLFWDYIHPTVDGSWEMAKIIADSIAGVKIETINDVNVAKGKSVTVSGFNELHPPQNLNDGNRLTKWTTEGFGAWVLVDIGYLEEIDMFQLNFNENSRKSYQYIIEASADSISWTTLVDQSARNDTLSQIVVDKIDPTTTRYVKIIIIGASNSKDEKININEFRILKSSVFHAPVFSLSVKPLRENYTIYYLDIIQTSKNGEVTKIYKKINDDDFTNNEGFREAEIQEIAEGIKPGQVHQYYTATYKDAKVMISDTLTLNFESLSSITPKSDWLQQKPISFKLMQNYPNPFNPETTISFSLNRATQANIAIFDVLGEQVHILGYRYYNPGNYSIVWDGKDQHGNTVASGIYYYRLNIGNTRSTANKMIFVK